MDLTQTMFVRLELVNINLETLFHIEEICSAVPTFCTRFFDLIQSGYLSGIVVVKTVRFQYPISDSVFQLKH